MRGSDVDFSANQLAE